MRILILFLCFGLVSCSKTGVANLDHFIFGSFFGECFGEQCIRIYKVENGKLFEDTNDQYPSLMGNDFNWVEQSNTKYLLAKDAFDNLPDALWDEPQDQVIGMPDAGDWGGLIVSAKTINRKGRWIMDFVQENNPEYLDVFSEDIKRALELIK